MLSGTSLPLKMLWPLTQRCFWERIPRSACTCENKHTPRDSGSTAHRRGGPHAPRTPSGEDSPQSQREEQKTEVRKQAGTAQTEAWMCKEHPRQTQAQSSSLRRGRRQDSGRDDPHELPSDHPVVSCDACHVIPHNP